MMFSRYCHLGSDDEDGDYIPAKEKKATKAVAVPPKRKRKEPSTSGVQTKRPRTRSQTRNNNACDWTTLPPEILLKIFGYLAQSDMGAVPVLSRLSQVCRVWSKVARTKSLWTHVSFLSCDLPAEKKWKGNSPSSRSFKNAADTYFPKLKSIKFVGYTKTPGTELMNALVSKSHNLSQIGFFNCKVTLKREGNISQILNNNKGTLQSFKIKNSQLRVQQDPFEGLGESLEELVIEATTQFLNKNIFNFTNLRNITVLKIMLLGKTCFDMCQLEPLEKVQTVHITQTVLGVRANAALKVNWPDLRELNLSFDNPVYINMHCDTINLLYLLTESRKLEVLDLKNRTPVNLIKLSELCPSTCLRHLNISGCSGPGFNGIFEKWGNTLEELYMDNCANFVDEIGDVTDLHSPRKLKVVSFEKTGVTEKFIKNLLLRYKSLTAINLQCCRQLPRGWKQFYCNLRFNTFKKKILK